MRAPWGSVLVTPNVLGKDGVSALSRELVRALPAPVLVLSLHDASMSAASPIGAPIRGARGRQASFLAHIGRTMIQCGADTVVVCSHLHLAPAAVILAWQGPRPTLLLCGIEAWVPLRHRERRALAASDLVSISQHTVDRFRAANPRLASHDVAVCHPGLPANPAAVPPSRLSSSALIVSRMSAAERYKGHDVLLEIWPRVRERHPDATLVVAGDGDDRSRLEEKARSLGLVGAVKFVGRLNDEELTRLYDECRMFVMPSRDEGFGLVFLEAMRAAKPCIGGTGAAAEIIVDGVTGAVIDSDNRDALLAAVDRLYADPEAAIRLGAAGRERFLSDFTDRHFQMRFRTLIARRTRAALAPSLR